MDESACTVVKSIGGKWGPCHTIDAEKEVCFDPELELAARGASGDCLVYSFGIGKDWSFEEGMAELGCRVRTFDPTVEAPEVK